MVQGLYLPLVRLSQYQSLSQVSVLSSGGRAGQGQVSESDSHSQRLLLYDSFGRLPGDLTSFLGLGEAHAPERTVDQTVAPHKPGSSRGYRASPVCEGHLSFLCPTPAATLS